MHALCRCSKVANSSQRIGYAVRKQKDRIIDEKMERIDSRAAYLGLCSCIGRSGLGVGLLAPAKRKHISLSGYGIGGSSSPLMLVDRRWKQCESASLRT